MLCLLGSPTVASSLASTTQDSEAMVGAAPGSAGDASASSHSAPAQAASALAANAERRQIAAKACLCSHSSGMRVDNNSSVGVWDGMAYVLQTGLPKLQ